MSQPLFGVFLFVIFASLLVLGALGFGVHLYSISELTGGEYGSRMEVYSDFNLGLSVRYPSDFEVNSEYYYLGMGQNKQIQGIAFAVPESKLKGTNLLAGTQASVEIVPNMPTCHVRLFVSDPTNINSFIEDDVLYSSAIKKTTNKKNDYEEHVYAVAGSSPCVAIRYFIRTEPITSNNADALSAYDKEDLFSVFDAMRHSLVVQK